MALPTAYAILLSNLHSPGFLPTPAKGTAKVFHRASIRRILLKQRHESPRAREAI